MSTQPTPAPMKTEHITRTLRNATSPQARLASYLSRPLRKRFQDRKNRAQSIQYISPELSSPDCPAPLLWLSGTNDPEVLCYWKGREFLNHRGWFTDDYQEGTLETYAIRLKRFPRLMFYAVRDSISDGIRVSLTDWQEIDFSECQSEYDADTAITETAKDLIRSYDSSTECAAEEEREFQRKESARWEIEKNRETLHAIRQSAIALIHELRSLCDSDLPGRFPAAAAALQKSLKSALAERSALISRNEAIAATL